MRKQTLIWLALFIVTFSASFWFLPEQVPLYYSIAVREDRLANKYLLLLIPLCVVALHTLYYSWLRGFSLENVSMQRLTEGFITFLTALAYISFIRILFIII